MQRSMNNVMEIELFFCVTSQQGDLETSTVSCWLYLLSEYNLLHFTCFCCPILEHKLLICMNQSYIQITENFRMNYLFIICKQVMLVFAKRQAQHSQFSKHKSMKQCSHHIHSMITLRLAIVQSISCNVYPRKKCWIYGGTDQDELLEDFLFQF